VYRTAFVIPLGSCFGSGNGKCHVPNITASLEPREGLMPNAIRGFGWVDLGGLARVLATFMQNAIESDWITLRNEPTSSTDERSADRP
jgi:hypothetical protein